MEQVRKNEIVAVVLFAVSLFLFLSIYTFTSQDLAFYTSSPNFVSQNLIGIVGAYLGGFLLFFAGKGVYVIPVMIFIWGLSRLFQVETRKLSFKLFGTIVLVSAVSASLSILTDPSTTKIFAQGGLIGTISSNYLLEYLGRVGAMVFIFSMIILSILVATEFLILPVLVMIFRTIARTIVGTKDWVQEKAETIAENIEESKERIIEAREETAKKIETMKGRVKESREKSKAVKRERLEKSLEEAESEKELKIVAQQTLQKKAPKQNRVAQVADAVTGKEVKYKLPSLDLLKKAQHGNTKERTEVLKEKANILEKTLLDFGVEAHVVKINRGPVITQYELEPSIGTKINKITSLSDNISLAMRSTSNIRIVAPLPGKGTIGIEIPNPKSELVLLRDILESAEYNENDAPLKMALGKDISGAPVVTDLAKMPHLLVAGATGSGKTVCLNCIISSLLYNSPPSDVKLLMIDPKRVELMMFEGIPHLVAPIVTNPKKAAAALNWIVGEMERRYKIFAEAGVRNITSYREKREDGSSKKNLENLPFIVVVVDELADLMMVAQQDVESAIMRIAQLSRAAGIHLILATQRPSVNVITGVIKANFPARISFKVTSKVDSRTVLDANGAEKLLGRGDMLLMDPGEGNLIRGQCSLVSDAEIKNLVKYVKTQAGPQYNEEAIKKQEKRSSGMSHDKDDLFYEAAKMIIETQQASVSMVQRKFRVGYTRAARIIDEMEEEGIVGPYNGSKPREILVEDLESIGEE